MPDDQNTTQNQDSTENASPISPQEPTEPAPVNTIDSEPAETLPEALESSSHGFPVKSTDIPPSDSTPIEPKKEPEIPSRNELNSEPENTSKPETAQTPVNEPFENTQDKPLETKSKPSLARQLLIMARNAIQFRKRKKLDKIMALFLHHSKITNDEVEKLLHVSDATATRYLSQLEQEGKIKQSGKTGKGVSYSRI